MRFPRRPFRTSFASDDLKPYGVKDAPPLPTRPDWDTTFMSMAYLISARSSDPGTKMGAVVVSPDNVVLSLGYNGLPRGMHHPINPGHKVYNAPTKYMFMAHAEENAILNAGRCGVPLQDATLYGLWIPCMRCARMIVQAGIKRVVYHYQAMAAYGIVADDDNAWTEEHSEVQEFFIQCGVTMEEWHGEILVPGAFFKGQSLGDPSKMGLSGP